LNTKPNQSDFLFLFFIMLLKVSILALWVLALTQLSSAITLKEVFATKADLNVNARGRLFYFPHDARQRKANSARDCMIQCSSGVKCKYWLFVTKSKNCISSDRSHTVNGMKEEKGHSAAEIYGGIIVKDMKSGKRRNLICPPSEERPA
jgi:hypothetical protein